MRIPNGKWTAEPFDSERMPSDKTQAIVLQTLDFGESDRIVTFFTRDFGKLKGIAKGAKRSRRRFGGNIEIFSYVSLRFFEKATLDLVRIEGADSIDSFQRLRGDLHRIAYGSYLIELVGRMTAEKQANPPLFELLLHFLRRMDQEPRPPSEGFLRAFEIRLLSLLGYSPILDRCTLCQGRVEREGRLGFQPIRGGVLCGRCLPGHEGAIPISFGTAKILRLLQKIDLQRIHRIAFSRQALRESKAMLLPFIQYRIDHEIRSLKFLESLVPYR